MVNKLEEIKKAFEEKIRMEAFGETYYSSDITIEGKEDFLKEVEQILNKE